MTNDEPESTDPQQTRRQGEADFATAGQRLSHILDLIQFEEDRGRITDLHGYLMKARPEIFGELSYGTVRGWFQENAPPMRKIDSVIDALQDRYTLEGDLDHIKTWWKIGGFYPFLKSGVPPLGELSDQARKHNEKVAYIVMSLVTEESGDSFNALSTDDLKTVTEYTSSFAQAFADPYKTQCPNEFLRAIIRDQLRHIQEG